MEIRVYKSRVKGWCAESVITMAGGRVLTIDTREGDGGVIVSHASVGKRERAFLQHVIFEDYSTRVAIGGNRATEKSVSDLHSSIDFDAVIQAASAHYEGGR